MGSNTFNGIKNIDYDKQAQLNAEPHQIAYHLFQWHNEPRKIHLAENTGIASKCAGSAGQAWGKILPHAHATKVEQRLRDAVCRNAGDAAEHHHVHNNRHGRLDNPPKRAEYGLFVARDNVAFDE